MLENKEQIKKADYLYGDRYASIYDDMWWDDEHWKPVADFYQHALDDALQSSKNWLDVGCGTGYFLSKFPHVNRTGLDRSESMLKRAKEANPSVVFYNQSMTDKQPELEGKFDLVSCTGQPYCYLPTMDDVKISIARLAEWTAKDGKCILAPLDIVDVWDEEFPSGLYELSGLPLSTHGVDILGVVWTNREFDGSYYYQLAPNLDQLIRWFAVHFRKVEVLLRPESAPHTSTVMRRVIVASEKREIGDDSPVTVITPPENQLYKVRTTEVASLADVSNKQLLAELSNRVKSGKMIKAALRKFTS